MSKHDSLWLPSHVIDDSTSKRTLDSDAQQMGCPVDDYEQRETEYLDGVGERFNIPLIPESDWPEMIREREAKGYTNRAVRELHKLPSLHQSNTNYCLLKGTRIRKADGSQVPIETLQVMDEVLTAEGNIGKVTQVIATQITDDQLVTIKAWGHSHLKMTTGHPVLTKRGYVQAADLQEGDMIACPRFAPQSVAVLQPAQFLPDRKYVKKTVRATRTHSVVGRKPGKVATNYPPDMIEMDYRFGRVVGLFLAEGHTAPCTTSWSFNINEKDTFAQEVVDSLQECCGAEAFIIEKLQGNVAQVQLHGKDFALLFERLCGIHADGKGLHPELASGPLEFLRGVLDGWMDGDRNIGNKAVTVSRSMANDMFAIANALGYAPSFGTHMKGGVGRDGIRRKHAWCVSWANKGGVKPYGMEQDEAHLWKKVREITLEPYTGYVFNLEVEGDNSYVAEGIGVHNCWCNGVIQAMHYLQLRRGERLTPLSPASVAAPVKNFRNQGGWADQALDRIREHGANLQSDWPANAIDRRYFTSENKEKAQAHKVTEWYELKPKHFAELVTCLLNGYPVATAFMWWRHLVTAIDPVLKGGEVCLLIHNSWGDRWGDNGMSVICGRKKFADEQVAPRVAHATASNDPPSKEMLA